MRLGEFVDGEERSVELDNCSLSQQFDGFDYWDFDEGSENGIAESSPSLVISCLPGFTKRH